MGGRSVRWFVLDLNLRGWLRRGSHNRLRRGNCYRLLRDRQSGFGGFVKLGGLDFCDLGFCDAGPLELLNDLCGGVGRCEVLLRNGGNSRYSNRSFVAQLGATIASALAAVIAVVAVGAGIASRPPLKVARTSVASLTRVGTRVVA
jgi:hypothetical protein